MIRQALLHAQPTKLIFTNKTSHVIAALVFLNPSAAVRTFLKLISVFVRVFKKLFVFFAAMVFVPSVFASVAEFVIVVANKLLFALGF